MIRAGMVIATLRINIAFQLRRREVEGLADGEDHRGMVEPHDEGDEEGNPREMQRLDRRVLHILYVQFVVSHKPEQGSLSQPNANSCLNGS